MITIKADKPFAEPPVWALLQRTLIGLMNEAADLYIEKYVNEDGTIKWPTSEDHVGVDALDDAYESFHNWPLLYLAGGDRKFLDISQKEFDAITKQFTRYDTGHGHPIVVKEYEQGYDWFHQGEGYIFFYYLGLADPGHARNKERTQAFAGFYLNEDPDAINYDPALNIVTSPHPGSMGPGGRNFERHYNPRRYESWMQWFGLPFHDLPGVESVDDLKREGPASTLGNAMVERMSQGDVVVNLAITSLMTHAYLWTGDDKYKSWVKKYVDGWIERRDRNGGVVPDNVGLNGQVGEYTGGKWYGGYYGWTWPHGWLSVGPALVMAAENAALLFSDRKYLDLPRSQIDMLIAKGEMQETGFHVPFKYGDQGWFEYRQLEAFHMTHLWHMSMDKADVARLELSRNVVAEDWKNVLPYRTKDQGGHDHAWVAYLHGEYEAYPEDILRHNIAQVYKRMDFMNKDQEDPSTYNDSYLQARNPVTVEGLLQLTMGAPLPMYNGGLLAARLRYYDSELKRPGLPQDVAALVRSLDEQCAVVEFVNVSLSSPRELIVQAGAYGEHRFTRVSCTATRGEQPGPYLTGIPDIRHTESFDVMERWIKLVIEPGAWIELCLYMDLGVLPPSYEEPWSLEQR